ncbi:hypothetical protein [Pseudorhizobium tarimense]|uniref:hypothetical protein n=1 Tax=Pseudorhizobium tarimense TaxID=1079109 RepID=UPI00339788B6
MLADLPDDPVDDVAATLTRAGAEVITCSGDVAQEEHAKACVEAGNQQVRQH